MHEVPTVVPSTALSETSGALKLNIPDYQCNLTSQGQLIFRMLKIHQINIVRKVEKRVEKPQLQPQNQTTELSLTLALYTLRSQFCLSWSGG